MFDRLPTKTSAPFRLGLLVIVVLVLWFSFRRLGSSFTAAVDELVAVAVADLAMAGLVALVGMAAIAAGWIPLLRVTGLRSAAPLIISWYFIGEITKYVPGGIWSVVGRGELAAQTIERRPAYRTVTHSLLLLFSLASLPSAVAVIRSDLWSPSLRIAAVAALGGVLPVAVYLTRPPIRALGGTIAFYCLAWLAIGMTTLLVADSLDLSISLLDAVTITAAAWLAGFVIVFVPGGVGVREAVFVALAPAGIGPSEALAIAVVSRLLFIAADMVGAALGVAYRVAAANNGAPD